MSDQVIPYWAKGILDKNGRTWMLTLDPRLCIPMEPFPDGSEKELSPDEVIEKYGPVSFVRSV